MLSPTQAFVALAPERISEAVFGRLSGKTGNDYGPRPSVERGEPTWGLIASAAGEWLIPADHAQTRDALKLASLEQGLVTTLKAAVASHQMPGVEDVSALLQALRLSPFEWEPSTAVSTALQEVVQFSIETLDAQRKDVTFESVRIAAAALRPLCTPAAPCYLLRPIESVFKSSIDLCRGQPSPETVQLVLSLWDMLLGLAARARTALSFELWRLALKLRAANAEETTELEEEGLRAAWRATREYPGATDAIQNFVVGGIGLLKEFVPQVDPHSQNYRKHLLSLVKARWPDPASQATFAPWSAQSETGDDTPPENALRALRVPGNSSTRSSPCLA